MTDMECWDENGDEGLYSSAINEFNLPHGHGKMMVRNLIMVFLQCILTFVYLLFSTKKDTFGESGPTNENAIRRRKYNQIRPLQTVG